MNSFSLPYHNRNTNQNTQRHFLRSNAVLMPASLLPLKATYTRIANQLPAGSVLILTPPLVFSRQQKTLAAAARILRANGHAVRTLSPSMVAK